MKYPKHLLPQPQYKESMEEEDIPDHACFIRWTHKNRRVKTLNGLRKGASRHIDKGCIYNGISCYLYSVIRKQDFKYAPSTDSLLHYDDPWHHGQEPVVPEAPYLDTINNRGYFCIRADKVRAFVSRIIFNANNANQRVERATLKLEHAPNNSNYWHYDLHVWACGLNENDKPYRFRDGVTGKNDNAKSRNFRKYMVSIMEDIGTIMLPEKSVHRIYITKSKYQ